MVPGTCLTLDDLLAVARALRLPADDASSGAPHRRGERLLQELHEAFGTRPGTERAWLEDGRVAQDRDASSRLRAAFRPLMPHEWLEDDRAWLSGADIEAVMEQYGDAVPSFWMVGVFPLDFAVRPGGEGGRCVAEEMCGFRLERMRASGRTSAGIILNLDRHDQPGSHWVALYVDADPASPMYGVYYYDSVSRRPPREVRDFAAAVRRDAAALGLPPMPFEWNKVRRQFKDTECGVFAMLFVVCALSREFDFATICDAMGTDDQLHALRAVFFQPPPLPVAADGAAAH